MKCQFCKQILATKASLNKHKKTSKRCLKIQGKENKTFECQYCHKFLSLKSHLEVHYLTCRERITQCGSVKQEERVKTLKQELKTNKTLLKNKDNTLQDYKDQIKNLQNKLGDALMTHLSRIQEETIIEIEPADDSEDEKNHNSDDLTPLNIGDYTIEFREDDGYINVTHLCQAGGKLFKNWKLLDQTKLFLQFFSSSIGIPSDELIKYHQGGSKVRSKWTHPQVAINIAQWISPQFNIKVSAWLYEIMMTGKVDISNSKNYLELQAENKNQQIRIRYLEKKYLKKQKRVEYKERNVIYILTTPGLKKEERYILGKATNLTNRLSVYNKSDEHEVIYYHECPDEEKMGIIETMTFATLEKYREQANRERFILPKNENINLFVDAIKKSTTFFS